MSSQKHPQLNQQQHVKGGRSSIQLTNQFKLSTIMEINYWTNGKICAKVAFPRYTESVKVRSQSRGTASKRKPYRGLGTR